MAELRSHAVPAMFGYQFQRCRTGHAVDSTELWAARAKQNLAGVHFVSSQHFLIGSSHFYLMTLISACEWTLIFVGINALFLPLFLCHPTIGKPLVLSFYGAETASKIYAPLDSPFLGSENGTFRVVGEVQRMPTLSRRLQGFKSKSAS
jgi:hypothetical protein